jgi:DNA-binding cell septation regulator SpoVG
MNAAEKIEIIKVTRLTTGGSLRGFVSIRLGALVLHDFRVIQQPNQQPWVAPPQKETNKDGVRRFFPLIEVGEPLKKLISDKVLEAWTKDHDNDRHKDDLIPF